MRKTLLIAAASLAASIISSQAGVYSQNIVGYVNIATTNTAYNYCLAVPFTVGASNGANEVFPDGSLPDYSTILIYTPSSGSYASYFSVSHAGGSVSGWQNSSFSDVPPPVLPVGMGFFLNPSAAVTNTFTGAVAINVGTTNTVSFANPAYNYLVGEAVPYGGAATTSSAINLTGPTTGLPDYSTVLVYNPTTSSYTSYFIVSTSSTGWQDSSFTDVAAPVISPGQGFFINPASTPATWSQSL